MSEGDFAWSESAASDIADDDHMEYEDPLGTQMPLDVAEALAPEAFQEQDDNFTKVQPRDGCGEPASKDQGAHTNVDGPKPDNEVVGTTAANQLERHVEVQVPVAATQEGVRELGPDRSQAEQVPLDLPDQSNKVGPVEPGQEQSEIPIKVEKPASPRVDWGNDPIEISDDEADVISIKSEAEELPFDWIEMDTDTIEISDDDDMVQSGIEHPPGRAHDSGLGDSRLTPTNMQSAMPGSVSNTRPDIAALAAIQQQWLEKTRAKPVITGAGSIFNRSQDTSGIPEQRSMEEDDGDIEMYDNAEDEDDAARKAFGSLKKAYKSKVKAKKNDIADDVQYLAAQRKEKARSKRYEDELLRVENDRTSPDSDQAADSDNELFLPMPREDSPAAKRGHDLTLDQEVGDDEAADTSHQAKRQATKTKRELAKAFQAELDRNRRAGVEQIVLASERKAKKGAAAADNETGRAIPDKTKSRSKKIPPPKVNTSAQARKPKPVKSNMSKLGHLNDLRSLGLSNIYDDANANAEKASGPVDKATRKKDALKSLMADVPLEDLRTARRDKAHILESTKILGRGVCSPDGDGKYTMKGMVPHLYPYQVQGSAMMKERETGTSGPYGGIMADEMGLGKTVMTIVAMVANRPCIEGMPKTTLIIATPALVSQWMSELEKHTKDNILPCVVRYSASAKLGTGASYLLKNADVILTTYGEVMKSYPKFEPPENLESLEEKLGWWDDIWESSRGLLHRLHFHRVVLDEAQAIKNPSSLTSVCCRALMARLRWAITGTPIHNGTFELYPYFKFLRVPHIGTFKAFQKAFCNPEDKDGKERLHLYLRQIMIRRTHATQLLGQPLLRLPRNYQRTYEVEFNRVERRLYDMVHIRYIQAINRLSSQKLLDRKHNLILIMLLRLRQLTAHPFLIQETIERFLQTEDVNELWMLTGEEEMDTTEMRGRDIASAMKRMIEAGEQTPNSPHEEIIGGEETQSQAGTFTEGSVGIPLIFKFRKFLRHLKNSDKWQELKDRSPCQRCKYPPEDPWVTSCMHLYCKECLEANAHDSVARGEERATCLVCSTVYEECHPCEGLKELEGEESLLGSGSTPSKRPKKDPNADLQWIDVKGELLPSSKTAAIEAQLERWLTDEPNKKIIVFSQFHMLLKIVGKICIRHQWGHCDYNGKMSQDAREKTIRSFGEDENIKVMVASLKCGGVGLNLTMASRVICVDLWWNSAIEQQAFCRVFRFGQESETFITRFVVKDSIDSKLVKLQKQKDAAITAAIDDNRILDKLDIKDLLRLFGPVTLDDNGNLRILEPGTDVDGCVFPELGVDDNEPQFTPKKPKAKIAKTTKGAKGGAKGKPAKGPGSRGGKGTKAAKARKDEEDLEAIEMAAEIVF